MPRAKAKAKPKRRKAKERQGSSGRRLMRESSSEEALIRETEALPGSGIRFKESEGSGDPNTAEVTIITPGWGSSGYYSQDVIERDIPEIYPIGTHMYVDHPTESDLYERPERSIKELAAVTTTEPYWDETDGEEKVEVKLFSQHAEDIKEMAEHIGVSIYAGGEYAEADIEAEGQSGPAIAMLDEGVSIDFVTKAGRGGKINSLLESARRVRAKETLSSDLQEQMRDAGRDRFGSRDTYVYVDDYDPDEQWVVFCISPDDGETTYTKVTYSVSDDEVALADEEQSVERTTVYRDVSESDPPAPADKTKENEVSEKDLEARLSEMESKISDQGDKITTLEGERDAEKQRADRAEDKLLANEARGVAVEAVKDEAFNGLPVRAKERAVAEALRGDLPVGDDGKLDADKLKEAAKKAAESEKEYLTGETAESGSTVQHLGGGGAFAPISESTGDTDAATAKLSEGMGRLGMSESGAKIAVRGR
jgi:hypothetical protein